MEKMGYDHLASPLTMRALSCAARELGVEANSLEAHPVRGYGAMLVSQDVVRREILSVKDDDRNPAIQLIYDLCMYGQKIGYAVILEGILSNKRYGDMLRRLLTDFYGDRFVYYFDVSFEETLRRHRTKPDCHEFGESEMREWWKEKDYLGAPSEVLINETMSQDEIVQMIISDVTGEAQKNKGA